MNLLRRENVKREWSCWRFHVFSPTPYIMALGARALGWYLHHGRRKNWRLNGLGAGALIVPAMLGVASVLAIDYKAGADLTGYWNSCILSWRFQEGILSGLRLIADFIWGWHHGRLMLLVSVLIAPLQVLAVYWIIRRLKNARSTVEDASWGSRSTGSLILLTGVILASILIGYPICAGRLILFAQVHLQLLAIEGGLFILTFWNRYKIARTFLYLCIVVVTMYPAHRYVKFIQDEPRENLRPMLSLIKSETANTVWVHPCSVAQVKSLPEPLPVQEVLFNTRKHLPPPGRKVWILWSHLGDGHCREELERVRSQALNWQLVHEGPGRGLALADF
ncbi:MAG: hypothetical protein L0229_25720 [Blastocatellia bacterium]|nr:hypothetical protein [Blastocatellia bacterium]